MTTAFTPKPGRIQRLKRLASALGGAVLTA